MADDFSWSGFVDWESKLRRAGARDLLKGTRLENYSKSLNFGLCEVTLPDVARHEVLRMQLGKAFDSHAQRLGIKPQTPKTSAP